MARRKGRPPCSIPGCEKPSAGRGWCNMHWTRWRKHGDPTYAPPTVEERFWARVDKTEDCWLWTGALFQKSNYGMVSIDRVPYPAHRFAYELVVGPIPVGMQLDHLCRVRHCVRPDHLEPVSCRTNLLRGQTLAAANAAKTHCPKGHPYDEENTRFVRLGRQCKECSRDNWRRYHPPTGAKKGPTLRNECQRGHPFPENLYVSPKGKRQCAACQKAREQKR
jgi:hypothetical protein